LAVQNLGLLVQKFRRIAERVGIIEKTLDVVSKEIARLLEVPFSNISPFKKCDVLFMTFVAGVEYPVPY
jgi:hypothetical protein